MSVFEGIFKKGDDPSKETVDDTTKLKLRKEELDISKSRVQKGDVEIGKEIIEEVTSVDIPIEREEVVIERRSINNESSDSPITSEETIKIPVSEEKVSVGKHTVVTGEIMAHKRVVENTEHIDETLKREKARIDKTGSADIIDNGADY